MSDPYTFNSLVPRPIDLPIAVPLDSDADLTVLDEAKILAAPNSRAEVPRWREQIQRWRDDARNRLSYRGDFYERAGSEWAQTAFAVSQVWLWDELLYSFEDGRFTPDIFIDDALERLGGLDAVVLWHAYPVIGIDERNQWDFYHDVPGLYDLVEHFHCRGIKVAVDYNPWDTQTRRAGSDVDELARVVAQFNVDAVFLDTLKTAEPELVARLEAAKPGIVLEGESKVLLARVEDHSSSWAQFFADSYVPGVVKTHYFERRHMLHHIRRWHRDHTEELQSAWLNGVGMMIWEVVFGVWVGWNPRDRSIVRQLLKLQRGLTDFLLEGEFLPLAELNDDADSKGVFASRWDLGGHSLYALVNRTHQVVSLKPVSLSSETKLINLMTGETSEDGEVCIPARGICGIISVPANDNGDRYVHLGESVASLDYNDDDRFEHRIAKRVNVSSRSRLLNSSGIRVEAGEHVITVRYRGRECGLYQGAPYVDEWKPLAPRLHDPRTVQRVVNLTRDVYVAHSEVTNRQFGQFVRESGYLPETSHRFLQHHSQDGTVDQDAPVTYVSLEDARAYCEWVGGRLPTEDEWQLAGESASFQRGSPAVWNWTDSEHSDGRSRFSILKGGSDCELDESEWYFDPGVREPDFSAKFLIPGLGLSRSNRIGFRVAFDGRES